MNKEYVIGIIRSILKEEASQNDVIDAIKKKYEVTITYDDGSNGLRRIQPVAYGKTKSGNLVVRAYQPDGDSNSSSHGWKFFRLDRIGQWLPNKDVTFDEPPEFQGDGEFNSDGDKTMSQVYLIADFGDSANGDYETSDREETPQVQPKEPTITTTGNNVAGTDTTPTVNPSTNSAREMASVNVSNDNNGQQTVGPVMKGNTEKQPQTQPQVNKDEYQNVMQNGPMFKAPEDKVETDAIDNMDFVDDLEDNEEENT